MKKILIKFHWILSSQFGIDLKQLFLGIKGIPRYLRHLVFFYQNYEGKIIIAPCLTDWNQEAGAINSEYFWQDLIVAKMVHQANPLKHIDIGSRIDGFVAHVAAFREIEIFDVRSLRIQVPNIIFRQADFSTKIDQYYEYCDSISCLHALEHFGLGRYGDTLDITGYQSGIINISKILKPDGTLYLSIPTGHERLEFNANYVFDATKIINIAKENGLLLNKAIALNQGSDGNLEPFDLNDFKHLSSIDYQLVIFVFKKANHGNES